MYNSINTDLVVEHVAKLVDSVRCSVCDKTGGTRLRHGCGHTCCQDCSVFVTECSECLTQPTATVPSQVDYPLTHRNANILNLLNVFESEFHIDIYKRQRISEQLKVEKELFPECIQAPLKYSNKRKTFNNTKLDQENRLSQLPGEDILLNINKKMKKQNENVELWLNQYVRKPFADLNPNTEEMGRDTSILKNKMNIIKSENTAVKRTTRKRQYNKSALSSVNNQPFLVNNHSPLQKLDISCKKKPRVDTTCMKPNTSKHGVSDYTFNGNSSNKSDTDKDNEAVILIDDSPSIQVDKDLNAWLAVQEAEHNKSLSPLETDNKTVSLTSYHEKAQIKTSVKVPFYLKSCLFKSCPACTEPAETNRETLESTVGPAKGVSITIENKTFVAVITVKHDKHEKKLPQSIEVQTDLSETDIIQKHSVKRRKFESQSQDIFQEIGLTNEKRSNNVSSKSENVIIDDSDSDEGIEKSIFMEVTAEIHNSSEEVDHKILSQVDNMLEHGKRQRRGPRGLTPTSTDSSEKENYNPNRIKKNQNLKKKLNKKT